MPILVSDRVYFRAKYITRDKEGHFMVKVLIQQNDITILKAKASKKGTSK